MCLKTSPLAGNGFKVNATKDPEEIFIPYEFSSPQAGNGLKVYETRYIYYEAIKVSVPSGGEWSQRAGVGSLDGLGLICHFATEMGKYIYLDDNYLVKMP